MRGQLNVSTKGRGKTESIQSKVLKKYMSVEKLEETLGNRNNTGSYRNVSVIKRVSSQKKPNKNELLKRFLNWIARGAEQAHRGKMSVTDLTNQAIVPPVRAGYSRMVKFLTLSK